MVLYSVYCKIRDEKGFTDYKISKETGIALSTISDWKRGISTPKADKLLLIANVLDIPVETLIKRKE